MRNCPSQKDGAIMNSQKEVVLFIDYALDLMKQIADSGNIGRLTYEEAKKVVIEEVEEAFWKNCKESSQEKPEY